MSSHTISHLDTHNKKRNYHLTLVSLCITIQNTQLMRRGVANSVYSTDLRIYTHSYKYIYIELTSGAYTI